MSRLISPLYREHVMLLCSSQADCSVAAIASINEALQSCQLCIYASVLNGDTKHIEHASAGISNYEQNVREGNLVIIDFKPYFQSALVGDLAPFRELKAFVEVLLQDRVKSGKSDRVFIFAEAAGALSEAGQFDKSIDLESWWNDAHAEWIAKKLNITVICPRPSLVLDDSHAKDGLSHTHTLTIELEKLREKKPAGQIRVLIVEPERDMCSIYRKYLDNLGINSVILNNSNDVELQVLHSNEHFDLILMDVNTRDNSSLGLSKRIWEKLPDQRIIYTTTYSLEDLNIELKANGITTGEILVKPFNMSSLISAIRV